MNSLQCISELQHTCKQEIDITDKFERISIQTQLQKASHALESMNGKSSDR